MKKKNILIYLLVVFSFIGILFFKYNSNKYNSVFFANTNQNYYFTLSTSNGSSNNISKTNYLILKTYDKNKNFKNETFTLKDFSKNNDESIYITNAKNNNDFIFIHDLISEEITSININNKEIKLLLSGVENSNSLFTIKDFEVTDNKLIYSGVDKGGSFINILDLNTNKITNIFKSDIHTEIPVTICSNKAAFLFENSIYLYSTDSNKLLSKTAPLYKDDILLYKNTIYTAKKYNDYLNNFVSLSIDFNNNLETEKNILKYINGVHGIYRSLDNIVIGDYFFNTKSQKLYTRISNNTSQSFGNILIGDYIVSKNKTYEKLEYNKNYKEYNLNFDINNTPSNLTIDKNRSVKVAYDGSVVVLNENTNNIINSFIGFMPESPSALLQDFYYKDNYLYGIVKQKNSPPQLISLNIENGKLRVIKQIINTIDSIEDITKFSIFNDKFGYLIKNDNNYIANIYDGSNNYHSYKLKTSDYINNMLFNNNFIVYQSNNKINILNMSTLENKNLEYKEPIYLLDISEEAFILSVNNEYVIMDFNFNKIKSFSNHEKAINYLNKNKDYKSPYFLFSIIFSETFKILYIISHIYLNIITVRTKMANS